MLSTMIYYHYIHQKKKTFTVEKKIRHGIFFGLESRLIQRCSGIDQWKIEYLK